MTPYPSRVAVTPDAAVLAEPVHGWANLRVAVLPLLLGLVLLGLVFWPEIAAALSVWSTSTAYNHCFLVLPIALWLAYERRFWLRGVPVRPRPWVLLAMLPCMLVWLLAERLGIMEGRQLMMIACVELLFLSVLGWRLAWLLSAPLLYLFFMVPFGGFLTPALQEFTARFIIHGLDLLGIANISDGNTIEIAEGVFFVAEACAGLRFLIASIAFGVLYAVTFYRSAGRRVCFIAASIVVPVLANGVRALGIVAAGHWVGSAEAAAADHLIYGWLFFSCVTLLLIVCGLPFRQDGQPQPVAKPVPPAPPARPSAVLLPAVLVAILAVAGPLTASGFDRIAASQLVAAPKTIAGCTPYDGGLSSRSAATQAFTCDGGVQLLVVTFPPRTNPNIILARQRALSELEGADDTESSGLPGYPGWKLVTTAHPFHVTATAIWLDGEVASGGLRSRLQQARNSLADTSRPPVMVVISPVAPGSPRQDALTLISFLQDGSGQALTIQMAGFSATPVTVAKAAP